MKGWGGSGVEDDLACAPQVTPACRFKLQSGAGGHDTALKPQPVWHGARLAAGIYLRDCTQEQGREASAGGVGKACA